ncbi:hypothetical protein AVEN_121091-1 [Araneus ventricosus]|uniref:Uncharacterized protein n=1 Tax=Araneus ventricosus TaxID=182803 RepID=A0A4Y2M0R4_ARAVE|nr:hypothetical protein AVEN_121091-1 [Araneus ventricosus]
MCGPRTRTNGNTSEEAEKNMKWQKLDEGKTIGGKGCSTDELIQKITMYYGNAVRKNKKDLFSMRKDIWDILMHFVSTDADPQHHFFPTDENSCGVNTDWQNLPRV